MKSRNHLFFVLVSVLCVVALSFAENFEDFEDVFEEEQTPPTEKASTTNFVNENHSGQEHNIIDTVDQAHDSDQFDEEEFVGFIPAPPAAPQAKTTNLGEGEKNTEAAREQAPRQGLYEFAKKREWSVEIIFGSIFLLYALNYVYGSRKNKQIARTWLSKYTPLFKENFHLVGYGKDLLVTESTSVSSLTTTGRVNCLGSKTHLTLVKRHDLFSLVWGLIYPVTDSLTITVPLLDMNPFIFAIVPATQYNAFTKQHLEVSKMTKKRVVPGLPDKFVCTTDAHELTTTLLPENILSIIQQYSDLIELIFITDTSTDYEHAKIMQLTFKIPSDISRLDNLMKFAFYMIDFVAGAQLSKNALASAKKVRSQLLSELNKESIQKRVELLQESKEKKKQDLMARMTPEELERYNEKQQKKRLRKSQNKQTKKVVAFG